MDPENLILTNAGADYIRQRIADGLPCVIGGFKLADDNLFVPDPTMIDIQGNLTYDGPVSDIKYVKYNDNEMILRCCVESDKGDFLIGNAGIYSDTGVLLFLTKFGYQHMKMASVINGAGGRWTYQVRLTMDGLFDKWSFDNLTLKYAKADEHDLASAPAYPYDSFYSEIQLEDCLVPSNRSGYLYLSGRTNRVWFSSPFQIPESTLIVNGFYDMDGGEVGDDHKLLT